jgi:AcrR family transcriptional regulator
MRKVTPEQIAQKREEIINACERLYQTMSFREITLKEIGSLTSFSRPTIYNYFETKEEIFLALLGREYDAWVSEMREIMAVKTAMTRDSAAEVLARTLTNHPRLLRLLSMNLYEMEANSRLERLVEFKKSFGASLETVDLLLQQYIPEMKEDQRRKFVYAFFPFIYGIYPYTSVTEKQMEAMREAGIPYQYQSAFELTFECAKKLLEA